MDAAVEASNMSTCARRSVGCVLVDHAKVPRASGFNGVPPRWDHCKGTEEEGAKPCPGAHAPSGTSLDFCYANHAEVNALLHCSDVMGIQSCYVTCSPCVACVKMLLCTAVTRIVFLDEYSHTAAKFLWTMHSLIIPQRGGVFAELRTWEKWDPIMKKAIVLDCSGKR